MAFNLDPHVFRSAQFKAVVKEALDFFARTPIHSLPPGDTFVGSGVYALYYRGSFEHYAPIAKANKKRCLQPIYVGKAVPPGWRTARSIVAESPVLFGRLNEHADSIAQTHNLQVADFRCRFMIMTDEESTLIGTVEAALIRKYLPLWNISVDGFGNHDPGAGRYEQARSEWDTLHPGRYWADRLKGKPRPIEEIIAEIRQILTGKL